jgi:hypothetical protein
MPVHPASLPSCACGAESVLALCSRVQPHPADPPRRARRRMLWTNATKLFAVGLLVVVGTRPATCTCLITPNAAGHVVIPDSVTSIGNQAFSACSNLASLTIPDSVTSIGIDAFFRCTNLASVDIGDSVTSIGRTAFPSCLGYGLVLANTSENNPRGNVTCLPCSGQSSLTIPDSVTSIGMFAFRSCTSLASVDIGNSVTSIGGEAFYQCTSLASVDIGDSVTSIVGQAFMSCTNLVSLTIPDSVTSIGYRAFYQCGCHQGLYVRGAALCSCAPGTCAPTRAPTTRAPTAPTPAPISAPTPWSAPPFCFDGVTRQRRQTPLPVLSIAPAHTASNTPARPRRQQQYVQVRRAAPACLARSCRHCHRSCLACSGTLSNHHTI